MKPLRNQTQNTITSVKANFLLKPLLASLCSLGLLGGCAQLPQNQTDQTIQTDAYAAQNGHGKTAKNSRNHNHVDVVVTQDLNLLDQPKPAIVSYDNLWDEIASQLKLGDHHLDDFNEYLNFYLRNNRHLTRVSERAKPYLHYIVSEVKKRNMPYEIALLPIIESGFQPEARSHQRAVGLWQFIPQTAHLYGLEKNWWYDGRQDIVKSTQAALDYLQKLYKLNNDDWLLALASYNGGIGNVWKAVKKYQKKHPENTAPSFWEIRHYLPKETQHYVPQLLAVSYVIKNHEEYNITLEEIENKPYFNVVKLDKQVALDMVASISDTPNELLALLNPGYLRPATPPNGPYHIVLPLENHMQFEDQISKDDSIFDIQWTQHKIKSGDTLSEIALKYKTSASAIKKLNHMKNSSLRIGKTLMIPIPQHYAKVFVQKETQKPEYKGPKSIHTVRSGESLWTIAHFYNIDTKTLCKWNGIDVKTPLRTGQKLTIRSDQYGYQTEYTLEKGDSLWTVAKKFDVTTQQLSRWNGIRASKVLQPGMKLTVWQPSDSKKPTAKFRNYVVKAGDSLWNIAKANNLSTKTIARYNQLKEKAFLKPGQVLKIPYDQET
ncbi:LysM peptidoglycan-binding domain-containing protein [Thiomicrorhabdus sp.]|uniref:LysM peptidoglycan-binding domain-containing protein n=1 Tax=Thiomicrorhabdus sp. TaxID=2039724 RepID=UPI0035693AAC